MNVPLHAADCSNLLLSQLPEEEYRQLKPFLEWMPCPLKSSFYQRGQTIDFVYFPLSGEHSVLAIMENGSAIEVGTVGYEGFSTIEALTGNSIALENVTCQIPGEALRMPIGPFLEAMEGKTALRDMVYRYLYFYLAQVSQSVACNRLHTTEERFAKWLLMCHDRVTGDEIAITQEFLADMLGVHRPSVSLIARGFQQLELIRYSRGLVHIVDRAGLEEASCECYATMRKRFVQVLGKPRH
ncbi:Crp/Fnr family transcriptional regulator [Noviherbaspirillum suwonense]|jgi:CRP-like cAMP-binding protein|uniref:cAMP-binding domain of CRP or a regulatory subunit of cAMP-dependent protein kinases n=1 Tax=Noviherbaspirillum suwonense TaxID=1224511 RepID=A0ABY1PXZ6_9BURK|nr:Crp/Fnr family transcriptional regulator [Noviherbaspirillum suwonense]SMP49631.1 cAMP-binding domain of CRP or a regulatory subunit of cAMP-dependent protein kinases [Noviherbaspirillum suwonense]